MTPPRPLEASAYPTMPPAHAALGPSARPDQAAGRVLVVGNGTASDRDLAAVLMARGHAVVHARDAAQARAALAAHPAIAVVIADLDLPGEDGLQLARSLRRDGTGAPAVLLLAAQATIEEAAAALRAGVTDLLCRPVSLTRLSAALDQALAQAATTRPVVAPTWPGGMVARAIPPPMPPAVYPHQFQSAPINAVHLPGRDLATISDALRNPLNAISCALELLEGTPTTDASQAFIALIRDGLERTVEAVELVEELCRLRLDDAPAQPEQIVDLDTLIEASLRDVAPLAADKGVRLTARPAVSPPAPRIAASAGRVLQLCAAVALQTARPGWELAVCREMSDAAADLAVVTLLVRPAGSAHTPPRGATLVETGTWLSRPQETLRLTLARQITALNGGRLTSWNAPDGGLALRLAVPRRGRGGFPAAG